VDANDTTRLPPASRDETPTLSLVRANGDRDAGTPQAAEAGGPGGPPAHEAGGGAGTQGAETYEQCDECGAPVDTGQRYCVACGAHRRHVSDPAARYLSQATPRSRPSRPATTHRTPRSGGRSRGLGVALALALIPVVAAIGVIVGRSSNNGDAALIQALARHQSATVTGSAPAASTTSAAAAPGTTARHGTAQRSKTAKASGKRTSSTATAGKASSTTRFGSVTQIAGSKPTQAQVQQGAQATQNVQKSTGKSYVNQQTNLPGTVVVP
jgi:hypothetical protein